MMQVCSRRHSVLSTEHAAVVLLTLSLPDSELVHEACCNASAKQVAT